MKKVILGIALAMGVSLSTFAQIGAGKMFAGGGLGISTSSDKNITDGTTTEGPKNFDLAINPSFGYFVSDNLAIGLGISFTSSSSKFDAGAGEIKNSNNLFGLRPMVRYYKGFSETFFAYVEGSVGFSTGKGKTTGGGTTTENSNISNFGINVAPGFAFFPTEKYAFELQFNLLGFNRFVDKDPTDTANRDIDSGFNVGFNSFAPVSLGFNYFF
ncbi:outer membrane beta-barrel protein [Cytophagales bacterium LB-30]|uniref:Outer membrane beta-barrel protein n=1 Tax=Shiella aurantiaca TaxID=3058365 RepID=A0ABT8F0U8_9BACT|nr:outer membrane beta-barrel protein [Shiella aurantiaca]MDN4164070.1 outer membrane beta-barrel protein [Shiella aurantiaca]